MKGKRADATYYEAHRDDESIWGPPEQDQRKVTSAEAITSVTISARFSPQDAALIRAIAKKQRINYSEVLRQGVIALANVYAPHDTTVRLHTAPSPQQRSHGHNATVRLQGQERPSGTDAPHAKILATT